MKNLEEYLAGAHPTQIKKEVLLPALEQIIEDLEDSRQTAEDVLNLQGVTEQACNQGYWIAIKDLVERA